jgi:L-arabinose isomerase
MDSPQAKPRVGVLALTLELYEQLIPTLRQQLEQWLHRRVLPALASITEPQFTSAAYRREDVDAIVAGHEAAGCDALLVICLTYSPSQITLAALQRTRLPIVVWNTQELHAVDKTYDGEKLGRNHGVHGTQDLANVLVRSGVPFHYVTSHLNDPDGLRGLEEFFAAASAVAGLQHCRLGLIGYPFPGMGDFAVDTTHLVATLGCSWQQLSAQEYNRQAVAAPATVVEKLKADYRRSYALADDLTEADLDATARAEAALRSMVADNRLDALSFQFLAFGEDENTETLPFVAMSRMMADGVGFAGEGDLIGAAGTWFLNRLQPPASFSEIFTIDFAGGGVLLSHMGEANAAMARKDRPTPLVARPEPITRTRGRQLALVNSFEPGPATLSALSLGPHGRWRLIVSAVDIQDFGPLPALCVPHCLIKSRGDVRDWLTAYAKAGGPHHHAICFGDARPRLKFAAALLDADYCEVS